MATEVTMPKLGLTMTHGLLERWLVSEGDTVQRGQPLFEIVTDKAAMEAEAPVDGVVHITVPNGSNVPVTGVVGYVLAVGEQLAAPAAPAAAAAVVAVEASENGQAVKAAGEDRMPETRLASPAAKRRARELDVNIDKVPGSSSDGRITVADVEQFAQAQAQAQTEPPAPVQASAPAPALVSPLAKRMAQEAGIDPTTLAGTGDNGRVTRQDVENAIAARRAAPVPTPVPAGERVPLSGVRTLIAQRMLASSQQTAPVTLTMEVDATELVKLRAQLNDGFKEALGFSLSYNDILVKVVARALQEFPYMNARLDGDALALLPEAHIGVAVDTERGLLVPVVRHAAHLSVLAIARELRGKIERATQGKSLPDDLTGGTFTITNLGALEVDAFTPIINPPEMAILGIGQIVSKPVAWNGAIALRDRLVASLTFDHRWVDGAPAARFLRRIKQLIEKPYLILIEDQDRS